MSSDWNLMNENDCHTIINFKGKYIFQPCIGSIVSIGILLTLIHPIKHQISATSSPLPCYPSMLQTAIFYTSVSSLSSGTGDHSRCEVLSIINLWLVCSHQFKALSSDPREDGSHESHCTRAVVIPFLSRSRSRRFR